MQRVLLVTSNNAFREALTEVLRWADVEQVSEVASVAEGRRYFATTRGSIDVAVVDLDPPKDEGTELVREMREAKPEMPILVLTSAPDREVHRGLREMGATEVLTKAVSSEELVTTIRRFRSE